MRPYYADEWVKVVHGDALAFMRSEPDASVDLIATDPPFFGVKDDEWDNRWKSVAVFLSWMGDLCDEWRRLLKPNGSLYVFASPDMSHGVEGVVRERFQLLANIRWRKPPFSTKAEMFTKEDLRSPFPASETILFAEQFGSDEYAVGEAGYSSQCDKAARSVFGRFITAARERHGLSMKDLTAAVGAHGAVNHGGACSNWERGHNVPTREQFNKLQAAFPGCFDRDFSDVKAEYEDLRRPYFATPDAPYTDVWDFATVNTYPGKHPCEKPYPLMEHIIRTSSRPGATVLDCFSGSGTTADAARLNGRKAIVCDEDERWCRATANRVSQLTLDLTA